VLLRCVFRATATYRSMLSSNFLIVSIDLRSISHFLLKSELVSLLLMSTVTRVSCTQASNAIPVYLVHSIAHSPSLATTGLPGSIMEIPPPLRMQDLRKALPERASQYRSDGTAAFAPKTSQVTPGCRMA